MRQVSRQSVLRFLRFFCLLFAFAGAACWVRDTIVTNLGRGQDWSTFGTTLIYVSILLFLLVCLTSTSRPFATAWHTVFFNVVAIMFLLPFVSFDVLWCFEGSRWLLHPSPQGIAFGFCMGLLVSGIAWKISEKRKAKMAEKSHNGGEKRSEPTGARDGVNAAPGP